MFIAQSITTGAYVEISARYSFEVAEQAPEGYTRIMKKEAAIAWGYINA